MSSHHPASICRAAADGAAECGARKLTCMRPMGHVTARISTEKKHERIEKSRLGLRPGFVPGYSIRPHSTSPLSPPTCSRDAPSHPTNPRTPLSSTQPSCRVCPRASKTYKCQRHSNTPDKPLWFVMGRQISSLANKSQA